MPTFHASAQVQGRFWPAPGGYWSLSELSRALRLTKHEVKARGRREGWTRRWFGNRLEYRPALERLRPEEVACLSPARRAAHQKPPQDIGLTRFQHAHLCRAAMRLLLVQRFIELRTLRPRLTCRAVAALLNDIVSRRVNHLDILGRPAPFTSLSSSQLSYWAERYQLYGFPGLFDARGMRKRGTRPAGRACAGNPSETPRK